ncbi:hypothetical protein C5O80_12455 [Burkholderia sp. SRS-46]|nr:hypothetical protein C5O80_12455 [Burkholderia sp. SRS-46]
MHLSSELGPEPVWSDLPLPSVAQLRELPQALQSSADWLDNAWGAFGDVYLSWEMDAQRAVHFGLLACDLAIEFRRGAGLPPSKLAVPRHRHFREEFASIKQRYESGALPQGLIPEMNDRLAPREGD